MADEKQSEATLLRIMNERRDKAQALREAGHNPYRNDVTPTASTRALRDKYESTKPAEHVPGMKPVDETVHTLCGRVVAKRGMGKTVFIKLRDGSGDLQLYLNVEHLPEDDFKTHVGRVDVGDIVACDGPLFWTKRGELSVLAKGFRVVSKSLRPLPDKWGGLSDVELRYRNRSLDMVVNPEVGEVFRKRSAIVAGIRDFLNQRGFLEVETPMMHPIIGGAAARPFTTHHNALDMQLYMRIAPELYLKRLVVGGFERVYEINRNFRNEGLSRQHNPEFTMLEFYQAYATYKDLMDLSEELITGLAQDVAGSLSLAWNDVELDLTPPWKRLSVRDAVVELGGQSARVFDDAAFAAEAAVAAGAAPPVVAQALFGALTEEQAKAVGDAQTFVVEFGDAAKRPALAKAVCEHLDPLANRVVAGHLGYMLFEETAEEKLTQPTFLTDFPLAVSPLARKKDDDPAYCDRFELLIAGVEFANAFSELNDPDDQRARFLAQVQAKSAGADETMDYDDDYCRALELAMPPAAGEGIGIDRLTMLLTGQPSIRDVILFPLMRPE